MKKRKFIYIFIAGIVIMSLVSLTNFQLKEYYYGYNGNKIYLNISKEKLVISYSDQIIKKEAQLFLENIDPNVKSILEK